MSQITLLFSRRDNPGSWLIRLLTWSRWSHVALVCGDTVIESAAFHGVREINLKEALAKAGYYNFGSVACKDPTQVIEWVRSQVGKPYDYTAMIGYLLQREWQDSTDWFCSELIAWGFSQAKEPLFRSDAMERITPEDLWKRTIE